MGKFRFAIMGAANIAVKFTEAVRLIEGVEVCAVASKSMERAKAFSEKNEIAHYYDHYETMLLQEKPDGVYIAVTTNAHNELTQLCLAHQIPVLCEKAMFTCEKEAKETLQLAKDKQTFVMEAMWSRFLPALIKAKEWIAQGRIKNPVLSDFKIGFIAPKDSENRYYNPKLGGGAAYDLTVYGYDITTYLIPNEIKNKTINSLWSESGVDLTNHIVLKYEDAVATIESTLSSAIDEEMVIYGEEGKVVIPKAHFAQEAYLYGKNGELVEHFVDQETKNGFTHQIKEVVNCIGAKKLESEIVPHSLTIEAAMLYDEIWKQK